MKILGVIPARGGSKSIKNKNIIDFNDEPLIARTIRESNKSNLDRVIVSTNDPKIANISKRYNGDVPFIRPNSLSTDTSHTVDVIIHAVKELKEDYDTVMVLQPTSPFRTSEHINESIDIYKNCRYCNSLLSICENEFPPEWLLVSKDNKISFPFYKEYNSPFNIERQQLPVYYKPNGAIYITEIDYLLKERRLINTNKCTTYLMDSKSSIDIDTEIDLMIAECLCKSEIDLKGP